MPCYDSRSTGVEYIENLINKEMKKRLDLTTRLLCGICTLLTERGYVGLISQVPGLTHWWKQHQEEDRQEELRRKKQKEAEVARKQVRLQELEREAARLKKELGK